MTVITGKFSSGTKSFPLPARLHVVVTDEDRAKAKAHVDAGVNPDIQKRVALWASITQKMQSETLQSCVGQAMTLKICEAIPALQPGMQASAGETDPDDNDKTIRGIFVNLSPPDQPPNVYHVAIRASGEIGGIYPWYTPLESVLLKESGALTATTTYIEKERRFAEILSKNALRTEASVDRITANITASAREQARREVRSRAARKKPAARSSAPVGSAFFS